MFAPTECLFRLIKSAFFIFLYHGEAVVYHQFHRNCISSTSKEVVYHQADKFLMHT